ncbi:(Fe-S)-binding protein [Methanobacterium aggregans]|uniref:(Fe-S)-binding protein n=1 Tax=Methanobacterium aggregans TaxID=1615586 RepID=UPI001AE1EF12|nr:(Fe-S)-binding protein [Methanobacterium aggregans]MBP2046921.1 ArsR family metal-binding transcriptional regulator [Methanobacterium aggregans]
MEMDEIKYDVFEDGALVNSVSIKKILPCLATKGRIRLSMQLDSSLDGNVIPTLVSKFPPGKVNFIKHKKILTLSDYDRIITFYPSGKITLNNTRDKEEAVEIISGYMGKINESYVESQRGGPVGDDLFQKLSKIGPIAIYNCLPKTNCEKCGEATCLAFAIKLLSGDSKIDQCSPLSESKNKACVESLRDLLGEQLMKTLGWSK